MKIGQYLAKIWVSGSGLLFLGHPVHLCCHTQALMPYKGLKASVSTKYFCPHPDQGCGQQARLEDWSQGSSDRLARDLAKKVTNTVENDDVTILRNFYNCTLDNFETTRQLKNDGERLSRFTKHPIWRFRHTQQLERATSRARVHALRQVTSGATWRLRFQDPTFEPVTSGKKPETQLRGIWQSNSHNSSICQYYGFLQG